MPEMGFIQEQGTRFTLFFPSLRTFNYVLMFKENHRFSQKLAQRCLPPLLLGSTSAFLFFSSPLFFLLPRIAAQSGKTMRVTSPVDLEIKLSWSDFFFFSPLFCFLEDFGLRQCCKSILLSPNVSRWICMEAVKVNDHSLTHSWWFQVEEKKKN